MTSKVHTTVGLGEILWDLLPSGKQLGGAPANFAHAAALLGNQSTIASRIGDDPLGAEVMARLAQVSLSGDELQRDPAHSTGTVNIRLDHAGQPSYQIVESVAWDFLEFTSSWRMLAQRADAVCFGTLAQRSQLSRNTIRSFLQAMRPNAARVFDVNLRQAFYSAEVIDESMRLVNIVKLNQDELPVVARLVKINFDAETFAAQELCRTYDLDLVCITRGDKGSLLVSPTEFDAHPGFKIQVADTIGAGDAFTAGMVHQYLNGAPLREMNDLASRMGAWVTTQRGAMPKPLQDLRVILESLG